MASNQNPTAHKIIPATESDLPAIAALAGVMWRAHYPGIISLEQIDYMLARMYSLETLHAEIHSHQIIYEQLFIGHELAGFAAHGPTEQPGVFKLHKLYLNPSCHGRGLGTLLLQHCEHEVRKRGAKRLLLTVNKRNSKAIAAYQCFGFVITDSVVTDIGNSFVMDDFVMVKDLLVASLKNHIKRKQF